MVTCFERANKLDIDDYATNGTVAIGACLVLIIHPKQPPTLFCCCSSNHSYETIRVEDNRGRLILPAGQVVDQSFTIPTPYASSSSNFYVGVRPESDNVDYRSVNSNISPVVGVSNYEYEVTKNEAKTEINLMKPIYLQQFLNDMRTLMNYKSSSKTVDKKLITTENTRLIDP